MRRCCNGAAEERSDLTRRRGVEAEVSRSQIPREVTTAWDEQQLWGGTTPCWGSGRLRCRWTTARFERILSSLGLLRSGAAAASDGESLSSISAVWLRVAWVPARSRRQKSSSTTTRASRATGSPGEASVSPPALGLLLRFGRSGSAVRFGSGVRTAHTGELGRRGGRPRWRTSATTGRRRSARPSPHLWSSSTAGASVTVLGADAPRFGCGTAVAGAGPESGCCRNPLVERQRDQCERAGYRRSSSAALVA
jgi:hypothetical protein